MSWIFVIEQDHHLRNGMQDILELDGYSVRTAEDGIQGLELLEKANPPPALIFCDLMMPHLPGDELLARLQSPDYAHLNHIPFILMSARNYEKARIEIKEYHGIDLLESYFLSKPFDGEVIIKRVEVLTSDGWHGTGNSL